ncbi:MAG TPA: DUF1579 domain-containing protein [Planctomycetaceae bacterium]|nr:DUF1579 domain-containing protein [Planctomycetaceae bacterium]
MKRPFLLGALAGSLLFAASWAGATWLAASRAADPPSETSTDVATDQAEETSRSSEGAEEDSAASPLQELAWLVGQWSDQGKEVTNVSKIQWAYDGAFLTRSFQVIVDGKAVLKGTQVVAWDPVKKRIRSWVFDSSGGFGEGIWLRDGNQWLIKKTFTLATGERASALNVITYVDENTFRFKSVNREIGGQLLPNVPETTVVRLQGDSQGSSSTDSIPSQEASQ